MGPLIRALGVAALAVSALLLPGAPADASAATPKYVAIVIGGQGTGCVKWHSGISGYDVLAAVANPTPGSGPYAGFVVQINGTGKNPPDDDHYWSYWHNTGGGWVYSNSGASGYSPPAGSVEGWSYDNGSSSASPPSGSFSAICGSVYVPAPAPSTKHTSAKPAPKKSHKPAPHATAKTAVGQRSDPSGSTASATRSASPGCTAASAHPTATSSPSAHPTTAHSSAANPRPSPCHVSATPTSGRSTSGERAGADSLDASPVSGTGTLSPLKKSHAGGSGASPAGLITVLGFVVVIGAGGGWIALRRRRAA